MSRRKFWLRATVLLASWCLRLPASALDGSLAEAPAEQVGLSAERLEALTHYLQEEVEAGHVAGAVALVARHGRIAYWQAMGERDRASGAPMERDTLFRIASMTKAITSAGVLQLVEEGSLRLDDPISKYLPAFASPNVFAESAEQTTPAVREITVHDLLTHTSGLGYGWFGPEVQDAAYRAADLPDILVPVDETVGQRIERLGRQPLAFQPGTAWAYGLSVDVLGRLLEVVTGLTLEQFFRERLFRPLRMEDTHFYLPAAKQDRLASLYTPDEHKKLIAVGSDPVASGPILFSADYCYEGKGRFFAGGSGLVSSTLDYARFLQMLLNGGHLDGATVLESETVAMMTRNQIGDLVVPFPGHGDGFGYGFGVLTERGKDEDHASQGTFSWGGIFNTYYWVDPQKEMIGILMTQVFPYDHLTIREEFKRLAYAAIDDSGFYREYWYEKGEEHGNPFFNNRQLRVNAREASVHPEFSKRSEPRSSGAARILIDEDLPSIRRAELYTEIWGGHPGTADKRVSINGRGLHQFPEVGSAAGHCTHQYPTFVLQPSDLVNGYNTLQFACDQGTTFWGHYIVDNACLRIGVRRTDWALKSLRDFEAKVVVVPSEAETFRIELHVERPELIEDVQFQARYFGYDENGNGWTHDWHGMTKGRNPYGDLGEASSGDGLTTVWNTTMLPAQKDVAVRALVRFKEHPEILYRTPVTSGFEIAERTDVRVTIHYVGELPRPFWSRAGKKVGCAIPLEVAPEMIESAELQVVTWTGGAGSVENYFTLNGHALAVAEGHGHEVQFARVAIPRDQLVKGANRIVLSSDTEHHGIEVLAPGPALVIRSKK